MGDHSTFRLYRVQAENGIGSAAHLEGTRLLEVLTLEEQLGPDPVIDGATG
jgi:hypothetical protein